MNSFVIHIIARMWIFKIYIFVILVCLIQCCFAWHMFLKKFIQPNLREVIHHRHLRSLVPRNVLGIETSCDDTGIAIINDDGLVLSEVCASQTSVHVSNGGIIPPLARDFHRSVIDNCVKQCFQKAQISPKDLSAVAVTLKPGLAMSLLIGCHYAKKISAKYDLPVIPIHHMEAHALTAMLEHPVQFPFVALLISGGHTQIFFVNDLNDFRLMGTSLDDAIGDILDKTARHLRLKNLGAPYDSISGGAAIELMARGGDPFRYFEQSLSSPMYSNRFRTCNFSFSGFLNAIRIEILSLEKEINLAPDLVLPQASDICASILFIISFVLIKRLQRAFQFLEEKQWLGDIASKRLVISGGCASNRFITDMIAQYCDQKGIELFIPSSKYCTDNGVMIAWNGVLRLKAEHKNPEFVLRNQAKIQRLDVEPQALLGHNIIDEVNKANIKCEKMLIKSFVKMIKK